MPCYTTDGIAQWTTPAITRTDNHILTIEQTDGEALPEFAPRVLVAAGPFPPVATGPFTDCK
jgi:hypothetical protein